jgi:uncharacterized membrane protein YeaQ/YmgE (transglycosylase-associated protein family)
MHILGIILIGLVVGILARIVTPGPNPRGIIVTIVIGIVGAVIATYGGQALGLYEPGQPAGFVGSVIGAMVLIISPLPSYGGGLGRGKATVLSFKLPLSLCRNIFRFRAPALPSKLSISDRTPRRLPFPIRQSCS